MKRSAVKPLRFAAFAAGALSALSALAGDTSEAKFVWVNPESCYHWHTATNSTMTLPVPYPMGASEATLSVNGSVVASGITTDFVTVTLPAPRGGAAEDVYDLSLSFDKGSPVSAKLGLVAGVATGGGIAATSLRAEGGTWGKTKGVAVIPIPYGTTSFTVALDGGAATVTDTGLDGAAGWYALRIKAGETADFAAETTEGNFAASVYGAASGFFLILR